MRKRRVFRWSVLGALLLIVSLSAASCILPAHYSDWQWQQYSPEWKPLPGDPDR